MHKLIFRKNQLGGVAMHELINAAINTLREAKLLKRAEIINDRWAKLYLSVPFAELPDEIYEELNKIINKSLQTTPKTRITFIDPEE